MEIKSKVFKQGSGYFFRIPKALLDCKILDLSKEYIIITKENPDYTKGLFCSLKREIKAILSQFIPKPTQTL